ncbi:MAG: hypothetical protein Ct9H300mP25_06830 [Acidobacteriota bacterium]|nr:MAG: hypothetical protein Ct9H300mP25_06830 [Acidobacteriota bacterium]
MILEKHPDTYFCVVGEGDLHTELKSQAAELGLGERMIFSGYTRDVAGAFDAFDVVVFPSLWEGTPLTAFEALAAGRPIVATDADGLVDILHNGRDALVVPKRDSNAIAEAVIRLLRSPDERFELSVGARKTGAGYDINAFVRKMEQLYELMCSESRPSGRTGVASSDLSFCLGQRILHNHRVPMVGTEQTAIARLLRRVDTGLAARVGGVCHWLLRCIIG